MPFFTKKINIFRPTGIKKMKTLLRVRRQAPRAIAPKIQIWTSKNIPDLWLIAVFCLINKIKITPPYGTLPHCLKKSMITISSEQKITFNQVKLEQSSFQLDCLSLSFRIYLFYLLQCNFVRVW